MITTTTAPLLDSTIVLGTHAIDARGHASFTVSRDLTPSGLSLHTLRKTLRDTRQFDVTITRDPQRRLRLDTAIPESCFGDAYPACQRVLESAAHFLFSPSNRAAPTPEQLSFDFGSSLSVGRTRAWRRIPSQCGTRSRTTYAAQR